MQLVQIGKYNNYFISPGGFIVKMENGKENILPSFTKGYRKVFVNIGTDCKEVIYLMIEAFDLKVTDKDKIIYSITEKGNIPLSGIKIKPITVLPLDSMYHKNVVLFKCDQKSSSANSRGAGILSPLEIFECLKLNKYSCFYCGVNLDYNTWQLDHFIPISKGGVNVFTNIVTSCAECNKMKSDLMPKDFITKCEKILLHNSSFNK